MKVYILRGIPGAGKTTFTKGLETVKPFGVCSADAYFMRGGEYKFDPSKLGEAHGACLRRFTDLLMTPHCGSDVVVDNTNTSNLECAPYVALAQALGAEVEFVVFGVDPATCAARNVHGVPEHAVQRMHDTLVREVENLPYHWREIPVTRV